ncbi:MAG: hypothetical protein Q9207_000677 [Kuettlingeria erythrocarpa]
MAKHKHHHARALEKRQETIVQVIYKTAEKTFDGPIGGYKTMDGSQDIGNNNAAAAAAPVAAQQPQTQPVAQVQAAPSPKEAPTQAAAPVQTISAQEPETTPTSEIETPEIETPVAVATPQEQSPTSRTPTVAATTSTRASKTKAVPTSAEVSSEIAKPTQTTKKDQDSDSVASSASSQITGAAPTQEGSTSSPSLAGNAASSSTSAAGAIISSQSDGMSGGAKAGMAIGILLAIGLLLGLIFFCYRRKKKQQREAYQVADDEKSVARDTDHVPAVARAVSTQTTSTAPRLSLRPVTQFLPDLAGKRKSGNALAAAGARNIAPAHAMTEKKPTPVQPAHSANPFADHAEPSEKMFAPREERSMISNQANDPTNPFANHAEAIDQPVNRDRSLSSDAPVPAPLRIRTPTPEGHTHAAGTAGTAGAALAAAGLAGDKANSPAPLSVTPNRAASPAPMPSPAGTEFSMSSATPASMANGPPPSNVHRVQLDFKPSMEDELGLRAGQLVRLLHEYDDGWALCIRLDRSQQGVAPRTCLSARPVKPRPNPNARGPAPRGPPPPGMFGPGQQRPMTPSSGRGSPASIDRAPRGTVPSPRPAQRSMSPGPYGGGPQRPNMPSPGGKRRSNSASEFRERRASPPGLSPMNPNAQPSSMPARKPVPGQAM